MRIEQREMTREARKSPTARHGHRKVHISDATGRKGYRCPSVFRLLNRLHSQIKFYTQFGQYVFSLR